MKKTKVNQLENQITYWKNQIKVLSEEIFRLNYIIDNIPADVYWKDEQGIWLGVNKTGSESLRKMGFPHWKKSDVVGRNDYELFRKITADDFRKNDLEAMERGGEIIKKEEIGVLPSGKVITQLSTKRPLKDEKGNITGIMGSTIDITYLKEIEEELRQAKEIAAETERLKLENEFNKNLANIAAQVVHDIRSPLTSLTLLVKSCTDIPEKKRIGLREAANSIQDIANNLLNRYKVEDGKSEEDKLEQPKPTLVSARLLQLLSDKRYEYETVACKLDSHIERAAHFAFIEIEPSALKRMISNLINNAMDACDQDQSPLINVTLKADDKQVKIVIADNGKGMPESLIEKIQQNISISEGKKAGHGIGLRQVREALARHQGELQIESDVGIGTTVTLVFPRVKNPSWIAEKIQLRDRDTVLVLDDDKSIHTAWDARFESLLTSTPHIQLKHFRQGHEVIEFVNTLSDQDRAHLFLLTDYELLNQSVNGLDVIEQTQLDRKILVTSHYGNESIRGQAEKLGVTILPKQLAPEIEIVITEVSHNITPAENKEAPKAVDLVILDDNELFTDTLVDTVFTGMDVVCFHHPEDFLAAIPQYSKETKILLDYELPDGTSGLELAEKLHRSGHSRLYLLSGHSFKASDLPDYLVAICKDDIAKLESVMDE